ncbi:MAG TPA: YciI family protein [Mycobacteriales bacterium]|nr:YciI family protein [Mycobacteriales bacterium]
MPKYLISFDQGWMNFPEEEGPEVGRAVYAVMQQAVDEGTFVFAAGLPEDVRTDVVTVDGMVTDGPYPETKEQLAGFAVLSLPDREAALTWAAKIAAACRCSQEVREFPADPTVDQWMAEQRSAAS